MKIFGYSEPATPVQDVPELLELTLNATPSELRRISEFLVFCADEMDRMGGGFNHLHLSDRMKEFRESPHLVVFRSSDGEL